MDFSSAVRRATVFALVAMAAALAGGCGILSPRLETPRLDIVGIQMLDSGLFEQRLKLRMRVQNPNDRALPVNGVSANLELQGQRLASGVSADKFTVPAFGESEFDLIVTANMATTLIKLLGSDRRDTREIDYRVRGKVNLASGFFRSIPFDDSGKLRLQ